MIRSGETSVGLKLRPADAPDECLNELGADIEALYVHDAEGDWRRAAAIPLGKAGRLTAVERLEAVTELRALVLENEPEFPAGAGQAAEETLNRLGVARGLRRRLRNSGFHLLDDNLMNSALKRLVGREGGAALDLPPRTYVAVTKTAVETPLGYDRASVREVGSFHVVVGRW